MNKHQFKITLESLPAVLLVVGAIVGLSLFAVPQSSSQEADGDLVATAPGTNQLSVVSDEVRPGEEFVGYRHKGVSRGEKLPNGVRDLGGGLMTDDEYGVTRFSKGDKYMLWLERILEFDADGVPTWEVKDVLVFDKLKKNQMFLYSYSSPCTDNGMENLDLIVMVEENKKRKTYKILKAWIADLATERFEETTTGLIACPYEIK